MDNLAPILTKYDFKVIEEGANNIRFESSELKISIVHDSRERSNTLWIGRNTTGAIQIEISNDILKNFFHTQIVLQPIPASEFIRNIALLFMKELNKILRGDLAEIEALESFSENESKMYTRNLVNSQLLIEADKAWEDKDFRAFIKAIDKVSKKILPIAYQSKYEYAKKRVYN